MNQSNAIYDGFDFLANGVVLTNIGHLTLAQRANQLATRANVNGAVLVQSLLGTKPIILEGYYVGDTAIAAQQMYDILTAVVNRQERPLIVPHAGVSRKFIATPTTVAISQPDGMNRLTFSIEFVVPDGYSSDEQTTTLANTTITTSTASIPINVAGSVDARPLIELSFTSLAGAGDRAVSIRNGRDMVGLTITRSWAGGDSVIIDSSEFQVYVNGVLIEPPGRLPKWQPGAGTISYSDTFTSRNATLTANHRKGFL